MVGLREEMRLASAAVLGIGFAWIAGCGASSKGVDMSGGASGTSAGSLGAGRGGVGGAGGGSTTGGESGSVQGGSAGMNGNGDASAGTSGGGSSGTGGSGGEGAVSSSGSGGESGEAGASAIGGSSGMGSSGMGSSGMGSSVGGQGPAPGFPCLADAACDTGMRCVVCDTDPSSAWDYQNFCAPDPEEDASGYAAATADCASILRYVDCDGPEDCAEDEYCAWVTNGLGAHCVTEAELPDPILANCCFDCSALPVCTLCWSDADCPETQACVAQAGSPRNVGGCRTPN